MSKTFAEKLNEIYKMLKDNPQVPVTVSVPIDPEYLNRQLQAVSHRLAGALKVPNFRLTVLVPAGGRVEIPFPLPKGFVCTRRAPLRFESNYYDKNLTVDVLCDGAKVNPYPLTLTGPFEVDFGVYYVKRERVDIIFTNNTTTDAEVTFQVIPHIISDDLYASWYEPLVNMAYDMLTELTRVRALPR